jgi:hypothetical protein
MIETFKYNSENRRDVSEMIWSICENEFSDLIEDGSLGRCDSNSVGTALVKTGRVCNCGMGVSDKYIHNEIMAYLVGHFHNWRLFFFKEAFITDKLCIAVSCAGTSKFPTGGHTHGGETLFIRGAGIEHDCEWELHPYNNQPRIWNGN